MQVSCKVSYSVLVYLERQGVQLEPFFEKNESPIEFLKDPSCWLPVEKMEGFLLDIAGFVDCDDSESYFREIGQANFDLRAWGVLDSVLKMVESPQDIFSQPERFMSYFFSPNPDLKIIHQTNQSIAFRLGRKPTSPLVLSYFIGAVEGLPRYMGLSLAHIDSHDNEYMITWENDQDSLFGEEEKKRRQFHPEIVQSVMKSLQDHQKSIEEKNLYTGPITVPTGDDFEKVVSEEVEKRMSFWLENQKQLDDVVFKVKNDFYKMYDYFTRAQQLITLISGTARKASVKEAMRRVDWEYVQEEFPVMVESACDSILSLKETLNKLDKTEEFVEVKENKKKVNINDLLDQVVEKLSVGEKTLKVDKHWLFDKDILVEPQNFFQAMTEVLNTSVAQTGKLGEVRIMTRPNGRKIEIEITDTGSGFEESDLKDIFSEKSVSGLKKTRDIIRRHKGNISISSEHGVGSTYLIEIPT